MTELQKAVEAERGQYRDMAHRSEYAWHEACARAEAAEAKLERAVSGLNTIIAEDGPGYPYGTCADTARSTLQAIREG